MVYFESLYLAQYLGYGLLSTNVMSNKSINSSLSWRTVLKGNYFSCTLTVGRLETCRYKSPLYNRHYFSIKNDAEFKEHFLPYWLGYSPPFMINLFVFSCSISGMLYPAYPCTDSKDSKLWTILMFVTCFYVILYLTFYKAHSYIILKIIFK